jgi:hypothetical protein
MTAPEPTREELLDALRAVREAINVPNGATVGDQETRDRILKERVGHAEVFLDDIFECLGRGADADVPWSVGYLRDRLAEHPAEGYKTWQQRMAEMEAAGQLPRKPGSAR